MRIRGRTMSPGLLAGMGVGLVRREAELSSALEHLAIALRKHDADVTDALSRAIGLGADADSILAITQEDGLDTLRKAVERASATN